MTADHDNWVIVVECMSVSPDFLKYSHEQKGASIKGEYWFAVTDVNKLNDWLWSVNSDWLCMGFAANVTEGTLPWLSETRYH